MSKINVLSSKIYNRIAAGEVVERPFSVVKELVENSLDAGATNIKIDVVGGGITSIAITDNGSGIEKSELKKALLPHATSKISSLKDLDAIASLGFRGEALASIASVSKISITSKPIAQELGAKITADGGDIGEIIDCGAPDGTEIIVNNLFFNTPAREKFLKTAKGEEGDISSTVARFILANPNVSFKYTVDGNVVYQSFGDGFESALICVYGTEVVKNCFYVETVKNGVEIKGYLGKHHFTKGNRTYQSVFVNGRYVVNQTISAAISNAYSSYLMKRQYPFYVLSVSVPIDIVDVNVHPNKLEVRFSNNQIIYSSIYSVVSKVLDGSSEALDIVLDKNNIVKDLNSNIKINTNDFKNKNTTHNDNFIYKTSPTHVKFESIVFNDKIVDIEKEKKPDIDIFLENKEFLKKLEQQKVNNINANAEQQAVKIDRELNYVGQVLNTYLILEDGQDLYFIDQHAAHERILYDKIMSSLEDNSIVMQPLLMPYVLSVNPVEFNFIKDNLDSISTLGIEICEFGKDSFKISAVPSFLVEMNIRKFFDEIISEIEQLRTLTLKSLLTEKIAQKACKAAIKSGDKLSTVQLETLINKLKQDLGLKCPHGRPVAVKISRLEIDKWFKRVL